MKGSKTVQAWYGTQAEKFEQALGDPLDPANLFSFKRSIELDECEEFPEALCTLVEEWGLQDYYVPVQYGGKLSRIDELLALLRVLSRRDLSVTIAHAKTLLGSIPVWIAGTEEQRLDLARRIFKREYVALALTEEAHGGDLAASECTARKLHDQYLLSGTKWLVNNATRSTVLCLLARTRLRSGPLGTSLLYVEKDKLDAQAFYHLPKIKTHGIRGIDISGIHFDHAVVPAHALIGKEYYGLDPVFKTFQITRTLCAVLSLGAADTALRLALSFALQRRVYGDAVFAIPAARETLVGAFTDLLICDCMTLLAARALHTLPGQMSLWSSVTKYFVPTCLEILVRDTATILGARYYLRAHYGYGMFQKIMRDIAIVNLFDGSSQVNLNLIASQLGRIAQHPETFDETDTTGVLSSLELTCSLQQTLPEFSTEKLTMINRGHDYLHTGLLLAAKQCDLQIGFDDISASFKADLKLLVQRFAQERQIVDQAVRELAARQEDIHTSPEGFALARRHCILHAASACYYMWLFNRSSLDDDFASGAWLVLCLIRLFKQLFPTENPVSPGAYSERVTATLLRLFQENRMFGITPIQLAMTQPVLTFSSVSSPPEDA